MACMKLKELEQSLQQVDIFAKPKILLQQYPTPPHIVSRMLHTIQASYGDIEGQLIVDLGCSGSGILSVGAAILGAGLCVGFDVDPEALEIWKENCDGCELCNIDFVLCGVTNGSVETWQKKLDCVILNPPFDTKHNKRIDRVFLNEALNLAITSVYPLHKTTTREHILKEATDCGAKVDLLAELRFDLPASYKFHKKNPQLLLLLIS